MIYHLHVRLLLFFELWNCLDLSLSEFTRYARKGQSGNCDDSAVIFRMTVTSAAFCAFKCKSRQDCKIFDYQTGSKICTGCRDPCADVTTTGNDLDGQCWERSQESTPSTSFDTTTTQIDDLVTTSIYSTSSASENKTSTTPVKIISTSKVNKTPTVSMDKTSTASVHKTSPITTSTTSTVSVKKTSTTTTDNPTSTRPTVQEDFLFGSLLYPSDCLEYATISKVKEDKTIKIRNGYNVFCLNSMQEVGAGWTVFLRRTDETELFSRNFVEYEQGFGDVNGNHWAGLEFLHNMTSDSKSDVDVFLNFVTESGGRPFFTFETLSNFRVGPAPEYTMSLGESLQNNITSGGKMSCMKISNNSDFSTQDRDLSMNNCSANYGGGGWWWGENCLYFNPTGIYIGIQAIDERSMNCFFIHGRNSPLAEITIALRRKIKTRIV